MVDKMPDGWTLIPGGGDGSRVEGELPPSLTIHEGGGMADDEMVDRVARKKMDEDELRALRRRLHEKDDDLRDAYRRLNDARDLLDRARQDRDGELRRARERNEKLTDFIFEKFGVKL